MLVTKLTFFVFFSGELTTGLFLPLNVITQILCHLDNSDCNILTAKVVFTFFCQMLTLKIKDFP